MKTKILPVIICAVFTGYAVNSNAQANTSLSNLTSPTAVNQSLLPGSNNSISLGSSSFQWKNIFLHDYLYLNGNLTMHTTGTNNFFIGSLAGNTSVTGQGNTATGNYALAKLTSGKYNTANGYQALYKNTKGNDNTAIGYQALLANTTGYDNVAAGTWALSSNTTGGDNIAIGLKALQYGVAGYGNVAIGELALEYNGGSNNTGVGQYALFSNISGNSNTAFGYDALAYGFSGNNLVAVGDKALLNLNGGAACTAVGSEAGINSTTGNNNTYLGYHAGNTVTTGSSNTIIGYGADVSSGAYTNATAIGNLAVVGASNHIHIGNSSVTSIGGQVGWTSFSDERIKTNIKQNVPGLAFINLLKPVTYNFDLNKEEQIFKRKDSAEWKEKYDIQKIKFTGFLAQEVEAAAKKINYDFSGVDVPKNDKDVYGLRYAEFVVPLVKAVQELSKMNNEKDSAINNLQNQINELKVMMNANVQSNSLSQSSLNITLSNASLEQNIPNPFNHTTTIHYTLPGKFSSAQILISDNNGKTLKQINISGAGKGSVNIDASTLSSGAYNYSLIADGKLIGTKQMILTK